MPASSSPGKALAAKLLGALAEIGLSPTLLDYSRPVIWGVTADGRLIGDLTMDRFLAEAGQVLLDSGRVFRHGNSICLEAGGAGERRLVALATDQMAEPGAGSQMANLVVIGLDGAEGRASQSLMPTKLVGALLASEPLWEVLPVIRHYGRRPAFDRDFAFRGPGWHPAAGILIHGPSVAPTMHEPTGDADSVALDRLPPRLGGLLREFSWRSDADLVNAVGLLLTGLLVNHFIDEPHPVAIVDANQPGVGKTLLLQAIGRVLDGSEPPRIPLNRDEELEKRLCGEVRDGSRSLLLLDNVRIRIESALLEQNVLSPELSFRVLGQSQVIRRPNAYLWAITSNGASGTSDMVRRGMPIRLQHDGDPKARAFRGRPLDFAGRHRLEILGELAGMVIRWLQRGKPAGRQRHRCDHWAATIGGILDACGLGGWFLANSEEAESEMDEGLQDLAALAEYAAADGHGLAFRTGEAGERAGRTAKDWVAAFAATQVLRDQLTYGTDRSKATLVGKFLAARLDRAVPIESADGPCTATLRCPGTGRSRQKTYYFEIVGEPAGGDMPGPSPPTAAVGPTATTPDADGGSLASPVSGAAGDGVGAVSPPWL